MKYPTPRRQWPTVQTIHREVSLHTPRHIHRRFQLFLLVSVHKKKPPHREVRGNCPLGNGNKKIERIASNHAFPPQGYNLHIALNQTNVNTPHREMYLYNTATSPRTSPTSFVNACINVNKTTTDTNNTNIKNHANLPNSFHLLANPPTYKSHYHHQ